MGACHLRYDSTSFGVFSTQSNLVPVQFLSAGSTRTWIYSNRRLTVTFGFWPSQEGGVQPITAWYLLWLASEGFVFELNETQCRILFSALEFHIWFLISSHRGQMAPCQYAYVAWISHTLSLYLTHHIHTQTHPSISTHTPSHTNSHADLRSAAVLPSVAPSLATAPNCRRETPSRSSTLAPPWGEKEEREGEKERRRRLNIKLLPHSFFFSLFSTRHRRFATQNIRRSFFLLGPSPFFHFTLQQP